MSSKSQTAESTKDISVEVTEEEVKAPPVLEGKQLVVSTNQTGGAPISFALTDAQFERALAIFTPPPRTKPNLWADKTFSEKLIKVSAYLESVQYMRPNGSCFAQTLISNHFDNCMIQKFGGEEEGALEVFSVDEWFNDTRGEVADALRNWDPKGDDPMPALSISADWYGALTETDLQYEGFVSMFANCIDLEEKTEAEIFKRKHGAMTTFGLHPSDQSIMPDAINQQANFDKFTPSGLLGGGGSGGLSFKTSGLI
jgi:hypothetical protein